MVGKHSRFSFQKYYIFTGFAIIFVSVSSCSTRKVPDGEYLFKSNTFKYEDGKLFGDRVPDYVIQRPNKNRLGLLVYNLAAPATDEMLEEYQTFPAQMRTQKLRDSLALKYNHPELIGKNLFWARFLHSIGEPPVLLDESQTTASAEKIRKFFVYKGYWRAKVSDTAKLDSTAKKASVTYKIWHKTPTFIKSFNYNIAEDSIRQLYEKNLSKSLIHPGNILDQEVLEREVSRMNNLMRSNGYYGFNDSNEELFFTADTLQSSHNVPITLEFKRDTLQQPYKISKFNDIKIFVSKDNVDPNSISDDDFEELLRIKFYNPEKKYKNLAIWRSIIVRKGDVYDKSEIDYTKHNISAMNNFAARYDIKQEQDSLINTDIFLTPLSKYEFRLATDVHYSEILNFGFSPSVSLTTRNIFHGGENLNTTFSGIIGTTNNAKNPGKIFNAYELSSQVSLNIPKLLVPFKYYKFLPKRYSPSSAIELGASIQNNIGLGRITFNGGLTYSAQVRDLVTHRLTLLNTQFNFTQNKNKYYELFPADEAYRSMMFDSYFQSNPLMAQQYYQGILSDDDVSKAIMNDEPFQGAIDATHDPVFINFQQSLLNKERQTQDVIINSFIYNFTYNEIGKTEFVNPFFINFKMESAGTILSLFNKSLKEYEVGIRGNQFVKGILGSPYSQFLKFDVDVRKYFTFIRGGSTLALRQFVGVGIPYGNSKVMPYMRSYYNGGSSDIRAWLAFGGLGPADIQLDKAVRSYMMDNLKLTTNVEYRFPLTKSIEGALFTDIGNIWALRNTGLGDEFRWNKFYKQVGIGSGLGFRYKFPYITLRLDLAYKVHDPNKPEGQRWVIKKFQPLKPTLNFAFGYPF